MNLTIYDILAHLIPGLLLYVSFFYAQDISLDRIPAVPAAALAYIIGFLNSILASWSEQVFYWTWGGKPSNRLLDGHRTWKVRMYDADKAKDLLTAEVGKRNASNDELFHHARRTVMDERDSRLTDLETAYTFSRNLSVSFLLSSIILWPKFNSVWFLLVCVAVLLTTWDRTKQKSYIYARGILYEYLRRKEKVPPEKRAGKR